MNDSSSNHGQLDNKVAIITGGASGLGKAICLEFASQGALVVIADLNLNGAELLAKEIENTGRKAFPVKVDVRDYRNVDEVVTRIREQFGSIDILINCAGWNQFVAVEDITPEQWEKIRSINLDGPWNFCKAVMPVMIRKHSGKIVNIGSAAGILAMPQCLRCINRAFT